MNLYCCILLIEVVGCVFALCKLIPMVEFRKMRYVSIILDYFLLKLLSSKSSFRACRFIDRHMYINLFNYLIFDENVHFKDRQWNELGNIAYQQ